MKAINSTVRLDGRPNNGRKYILGGDIRGQRKVNAGLIKLMQGVFCVKYTRIRLHRRYHSAQ